MVCLYSQNQMGYLQKSFNPLFSLKLCTILSNSVYFVHSVFFIRGFIWLRLLDKPLLPFLLPVGEPPGQWWCFGRRHRQQSEDNSLHSGCHIWWEELDNHSPTASRQPGRPFVSRFKPKQATVGVIPVIDRIGVQWEGPGVILWKVSWFLMTDINSFKILNKNFVLEI